MTDLLNYLKPISIFIGGIVGLLIGELNGIMAALLIFMVADWLTGLMVAGKNKSVSSAIGFDGLFKKITILVLVIIGNAIDIWVIGNGAVFRSAVIMFYIANEGISILENTTKLGVPYPDKIKDVLIQLKEKSDSE